MAVQRAFTAFLFLQVVLTSGCAGLSKAVHFVGDIVDPKNIHTEPACTACGSTPGALPVVNGTAIVAPAESPVVQAQHLVASDTELLRNQMQEITTETNALKTQMNTMSGEINKRSEALIATRAEISRLKTELTAVRTQISQDSALWQRQLAELQANLESREQMRSQRLRELTQMVTDLVRQNVDRAPQYDLYDDSTRVQPNTTYPSYQALTPPANQATTGLRSPVRPASPRTR
ncbi:MAG: hypothetical protein KDA87_11230 [Planctomycetales bacterium]|nr:hypothetical protein [Planctomycetales bacterium]